MLSAKVLNVEHRVLIPVERQRPPLPTDSSPSLPRSSADIMPGMALALSIFGIAFAAFCVWLTVRIVNRRERWAKWTLAAVVSMPLLYVACFGPACWVSSYRRDRQELELVSVVYQPLLATQFRCPDAIAQPIGLYAFLFANIDSTFKMSNDGHCRWSYRGP
jgi:hypothetical protein